MRQAFLAALAAAFLAQAALAHEGGLDAKGTVEAIAEDRIDVRTAKGVKSFALTPRTEIVKGRAPAKAGDLRPGDRVVVHARARDGKLEAFEVRAGSGKPQPAR